MRPTCWLAGLLACAFLAGLAPLAGQADDEAPLTAMQRLQNLLAEPLVLTSSWSPSDLFQCEARLQFRREATGPLESRRYLIERQGPDVAVALLSDAGIPYAHFQNSRYVRLDSRQPGRFQTFENCPIQLRVGEPGETWLELTARAEHESSLIVVNVCGLLDQLKAGADSIRYDQRTRTLHFEKADGAGGRVVLSADLAAFPVREITARNSAGETFTLTNLYVGRPPLRSLTKLRDGLPPRATLADEGASLAPEEFDEALRQGCPAEIEEEPLSRAEGQRWLESFPLESSLALFPGESELLRENLDRLQAGAADAGAAAEALADVRRAVHQLAIVPLRPPLKGFDPTPVDLLRQEVAALAPPAVSAPAPLDHDRRASVGRFEAGYGREVSELFWRRLCDVAADPARDADLRRGALRLLGDVGVTDFARLEEALSPLEDEACPLLLTSWAAARCRIGRPCDCDVERLHRCLDDSQADPALRYEALEALALIDDLAGHGAAVRQLLSPDFADQAPEPLAAYVSAIGAATSGVELILELLRADPTGLPQDEMLWLACRQLRKGEVNVPRMVEALRDIALDERVAPAARRTAIRVAWKPTAVDPARSERFVRSALASSSPLLVRIAADVMREQRCAHEYLPELEALLASPDPELRLSAALGCSVCALPEVPERDREWLFRMLAKIVADEVPRVSDVGFNSLLRSREQGVEIPTHCLAAAANTVLGETHSHSRFMRIAPIFCRLPKHRIRLENLITIPAKAKSPRKPVGPATNLNVLITQAPANRAVDQIPKDWDATTVRKIKERIEEWAEEHLPEGELSRR